MHRPSGQRQIDQHVFAAMKSSSKGGYRLALGSFLLYLTYYNLIPETPTEVDDYLLEWKADNCWLGRVLGAKQPNKNTFEKAIAAIHKAVPACKGQLHGAYEVMKAWRVVLRPHHHVPMSKPWALLIGAWLGDNGYAREGALLILQYYQALRPSEAIQLFGEGLVSPEDYPFSEGAGMILLGQRAGTKLGRPQCSLVREPIPLAILRWFRATTAKGRRLSAVSNLNQWNRLLTLACVALNLVQMGWTGHSPRAGRASDLTLLGRPFLEIRELGRWTSDSSLRHYLDLMAVMGGEAARALQPRLPQVRELEAQFVQRFRWWNC
jgi:hypothetical protein